MDVIKKAKSLPHRPGCYLYFNQGGQVIYVGKAKDLQKRVITYFTKAHDLKTTRLVRELTDFNYFVVNNEKEALLLEDNLIKKYRPKYNVLLNDDRAYPYIIVTNEKNPEYRYVRKYDAHALKSYGPLPIGSQARQLLITLQRVFPLRRCRGDLGKPCLYYHLGQCSGACFQEVPWTYYEAQLQPLTQFFQGKTKKVRLILEKKMQTAAAAWQFEEAQRLKNLLKALDLAQKTNDVTFHDSRNRDVLAYALAETTLVINLLFYRHGKLLSKDEYVMVYDEQDLNELLGSYLAQIYAKNMLPDQLILPAMMDLTGLNLSLKKLSSWPITPTEQKLMHLAQNNANEALRLALLKNPSGESSELNVLSLLKTQGQLQKYPHHLEIFDIANSGNEFVTGSCLVYLEGKPERNSFRRYNIQIDEKGDLQRLENLLYRRFQKALLTKASLPDLIIVDGGLNHVHFARRVLNSLGLTQIEVLGLSKDQLHHTHQLITASDQLVILDRHTPLYNFLSRLQIRVDAFAKAGLHSKQQKQLMTNPLLGVLGIGPKKLQELYKVYPTIFEMQAASSSELNKILKNEATTKRLLAYLATI